MLTASATLMAVSNRVGNDPFSMKELTEATSFVAFDKWRQMRTLSGSPGACGWMTEMSGDDWKGPRRIDSTSG